MVQKELIQGGIFAFLAIFVLLESKLAELHKTQPDFNELLMLMAHTALQASHGKPKRLAIFMRLLGLAFRKVRGTCAVFTKRIRSCFGGFCSIKAASPELSDEERFGAFILCLARPLYFVGRGRLDGDGGA